MKAQGTRTRTNVLKDLSSTLSSMSAMMLMRWTRRQAIYGNKNAKISISITITITSSLPVFDRDPQLHGHISLLQHDWELWVRRWPWIWRGGVSWGLSVMMIMIMFLVVTLIKCISYDFKSYFHAHLWFFCFSYFLISCVDINECFELEDPCKEGQVGKKTMNLGHFGSIHNTQIFFRFASTQREVSPVMNLRRMKRSDWTCFFVKIMEYAMPWSNRRGKIGKIWYILDNRERFEFGCL